MNETLFNLVKKEADEIIKGQRLNINDEKITESIKRTITEDDYINYLERENIVATVFSEDGYINQLSKESIIDVLYADKVPESGDYNVMMKFLKHDNSRLIISECGSISCIEEGKIK